MSGGDEPAASMGLTRVVLTGIYVVAPLIAALLARAVQYAPFGHDEIEHAHAAKRRRAASHGVRS